jgi:hypothetical protein
MRRLRRLFGLELPRETQPSYLVRSELPALFARAGYRLEVGGPTFGPLARLIDLAAVLLGRAGLPTRPVLFARRDG